MDTIKEIPGYPGYFVSDTGKVFSRRASAQRGNKLRELKPYLHKGYRYVHLYERNWTRRIYCGAIHRLMLIAFVGKRSTTVHACHNDGNSLNNTLDNLRWDTALGNSKDQVKHGTKARGERAGLAKLTEEDIREIRTLATQMSHRKLAARFGVGKSTISQILWRQTWQHIA